MEAGNNEQIGSGDTPRVPPPPPPPPPPTTRHFEWLVHGVQAHYGGPLAYFIKGTNSKLKF